MEQRHVRITPDGKYMFADNLGTDQIHKFIINPDANAENKESFLKEGSPSVLMGSLQRNDAGCPVYFPREQLSGQRYEPS